MKKLLSIFAFLIISISCDTDVFGRRIVTPQEIYGPYNEEIHKGYKRYAGDVPPYVRTDKKVTYDDIVYDAFNYVFSLRQEQDPSFQEFVRTGVIKETFQTGILLGDYKSIFIEHIIDSLSEASNEILQVVLSDSLSNADHHNRKIWINIANNEQKKVIVSIMNAFYVEKMSKLLHVEDDTNKNATNKSLLLNELKTLLGSTNAARKN